MRYTNHASHAPRCFAVILLATSCFPPNLVVPNLAGANWSPINNGLPGSGVTVNTLVIDPVSPSTLYAQTNSFAGGGLFNALNQGLFKTSDGGDNWTAVGSITNVLCVAVNPANSAIVYAGTSQGVERSSDGGQTWTDVSSNLPAGSIGRLIIDPGTPSTLYVISTIAPVALQANVTTSLFKTTNGGGNWTQLNTGLPSSAYVTTMLLAPSDPSTIYIFAPPSNPALPNGPLAGGLLRSSDGGQSWMTVNGDLPFTTLLVSGLTIDPTTSTTLYAATSQGAVKTTDGGQTWSGLNLGLASNSSLGIVVTDPADPSAVYATVRTFGPGGQTSSLLKSTDGGATWSALGIATPTNSTITSIAIDPTAISRIYASVVEITPGPLPALSGGAVFKTADGGQTWNSSAAGLVTLDIRAVAVKPGDAGVIFAGGSGGVSRSSDGGATWNPTALTSYTSLLLSDAASPGNLYALTGSSNGCNSSDALLLVSSDEGADWTSGVSPFNSGCILNATFPSVNAPPMAIDPSNPNTLYLGESDDQDGYSAILKSSDAAADWFAAWDWFNGLRAGVRALAVDPSQTGIVYAGADDGAAADGAFPSGSGMGGLFKSTDGGNTWTNTGWTASAVTLLAIDPSTPQTVYAGIEGHYTQPAGFQGLFKSTDGGQTWIAINAGLAGLIGARSTTAAALVIDPADSQVLYLGTSTSGVYRSSDGGASWNPFNDGLTSFAVRSLVIAPDSSHAVYAATAGGVFKYADDVAPASSTRFGATR